jgi:IS30 family transposase
VAQARLSVRKIRDVLRLKNEAHLSDRQIAAVLGSARSTVQECLKRARSAGLSWPLPQSLTMRSSARVCMQIGTEV